MKATTAFALKKASSTLDAVLWLFIEIRQVFPEVTLHIVPDAGHSSREPGIEKLLVEVCMIVPFKYISI